LICKGIPNLESLGLIEISKCSDECLTIIGTYCKKLNCFTLEKCLEITDSGVHHLVELCPNIQKLYFAEVNISDETMKSIAKLPIKELAIDACTKVTDQGLQLFLAESAKETITLLDLSRCESITDNAMEFIGKCSNLSRIKLFMCSQITETGTELLLKYLPQLQIEK
jgi:F-box/leucine-rich repeat protein 2/20